CAVLPTGRLAAVGGPSDFGRFVGPGTQFLAELGRRLALLLPWWAIPVRGRNSFARVAVIALERGDARGDRDVSLAAPLRHSRHWPITWPRPIGLLALVAACVAAHAYTSSLRWDQPNPLALADHLFSVALLAGLLWLAAAIGPPLLRAFVLSRPLALGGLLFA